MRFSKKIVVLMFATVYLFVVAMILTFWHTGGVPDTLIVSFFSFFCVEGGALGIIKVSEEYAKKAVSKVTKKKSKGKKENEE